MIFHTPIWKYTKNGTKTVGDVGYTPITQQSNDKNN